jgi:hypothetical protein
VRFFDRWDCGYECDISVAYLPACDTLPVVCVHHNVESERLRRRASIEAIGARRAYLSYQAHLMESVERKWSPRVALNVVVSEADRAALTRIAPTSRFVVVPNGVDLDKFRSCATVGDGVAGFGSLDWFPNRDALEFFVPRSFLISARQSLKFPFGGSAPRQRSSNGRTGSDMASS